jgi:hypothetical protein
MAGGGDHRTVRQEPTSRRELTNRRQTEVFILCGLVTVTFQVLLYIVAKGYSHRKIVLQLIVVLSGEYQIDSSNPEPMNCRIN